jgi:hypothetical protein
VFPYADPFLARLYYTKLLYDFTTPKKSETRSGVSSNSEFRVSIRYVGLIWVPLTGPKGLKM